MCEAHHNCCRLITENKFKPFADRARGIAHQHVWCKRFVLDPFNTILDGLESEFEIGGLFEFGNSNSQQMGVLGRIIVCCSSHCLVYRQGWGIFPTLICTWLICECVEFFSNRLDVMKNRIHSHSMRESSFDPSSFSGRGECSYAKTNDLSSSSGTASFSTQKSIRCCKVTFGSPYFFRRYCLWRLRLELVLAAQCHSYREAHPKFLSDVFLYQCLHIECKFIRFIGRGIVCMLT